MKTVTVNPVIECLLQARERIRNGWCQKAFDVDGKVCALMALESRTKNVVHDAHYILAHALPDEWGCNVIAYNDAAGRTRDDILALYDRAIQAELEDQG